MAEFSNLWNDTPEPDSAPPLHLVDAYDFVAQPLPRPEQLIKDLLHRGLKMALGGGSKSFKTWALLDMAVSVSYGIPWLGFPTAQARVLFVNLEIPDWAWQDRIEAIVSAKNVTPERGHMTCLNLRGQTSSYITLLPQLAAEAKKDFGLIVLDPIYKIYGQTDENKAGDIARLMNAIDELSNATTASVSFGAHYSKGNQSAKESIDRMSGSGVFARDPDSLLMLTRHKENDCYTVEPTLRLLPSVPPFVIRWQFPLFVRDATLDPTELKQPGRKAAHRPEDLLAFIVESTKENPVSWTAWAEAAGIPRSTLTDYSEKMRKAGWLATTGEGTTARQYITEKGREAVRLAKGQTKA
jgi:hypothetical protein